MQEVRSGAGKVLYGLGRIGAIGALGAIVFLRPTLEWFEIGLVIAAGIWLTAWAARHLLDGSRPRRVFPADWGPSERRIFVFFGLLMYWLIGTLMSPNEPSVKQGRDWSYLTGSARTKFIKAGVEECRPAQRNSVDNAGMPTELLDEYCDCYAGRLANRVIILDRRSPPEFTKFSETHGEEVDEATDYCRGRLQTRMNEKAK